MGRTKAREPWRELLENADAMWEKFRSSVGSDREGEATLDYLEAERDAKKAFEDAEDGRDNG